MINEIVKKIFSSDLENFKPIDFKPVDKKNSGVTIFSDKLHNNPLKTILVGSINEYQKFGPVDKGGIWRGVIPYMYIAPFMNNKGLLVFRISNIINSGLRDLQYNLGDLKNYKVTLGFDDGDFLKDSEAFGGYQIMIKAEKKN